MGRIVENLWDCSSCGTRGNRGRDYVCPNCGKTRGEDVRFYLPSQITYYDKPIEQGPDWYCEYCGSYNKYSASHCKNCGAAKGSINYFNINETPKATIKEEPHSKEVTFSLPIDDHNYKTRSKKVYTNWARIATIILLFSFISSLIWAAIPKEKTITVDSVAWQREIEIETNTLITENDWSVPIDAVEVLYTRQEIHHYVSVLDHYETITETKSRQVFDGYDTYYTYQDLGNGFSEEIEHSSPRYRTEYYIETRQEPVYRNEPIYETKYYYSVWQYIYDHTETAEGIDYNPYWPEYNFVGDQRVGGQREVYNIFYLNKKSETVSTKVADQELWEQLEIGKTYKVMIVLGYINEIKGEVG